MMCYYLNVHFQGQRLKHAVQSEHFGQNSEREVLGQWGPYSLANHLRCVERSEYRKYNWSHLTSKNYLATVFKPLNSQKRFHKHSADILITYCHTNFHVPFSTGFIPRKKLNRPTIKQERNKS